MIEFLRGTVVVKGPTRLVLDVQGVGYGIDVTLKASESAPNIGEIATVLTWLHVKEELLELYGFASPLEKQVFLKLISVSGIGPRMGLRMLSSCSPRQLADLILSGDVKGLSALKGIGKKTAEVMIATLRAPMQKIDFGLDKQGRQAGQPLTPQTETHNDAVQALISLGVKDAAALEAVHKALQKLGDKAEKVQVSHLIALALQET